MPSTAPSILERYLDKVIQDNKTIDARGVMQVNRMIELSMEDVFIHLTVRMNRSDKWSSLLDTINLYHTYSEPDSPFTRKPIPRVPQIPWPSYSDYGETEQGIPTDALWQRHAAWVILGDPGAGKTTLLKHFALQEATTCKTGLDSGYLPVFVPLRLLGQKLENHMHWPLEQALLDYLTQYGLGEMGFTAEQERLELRAQFETWLSNGRVLWLLDGLDEQRDQHVQKRTVAAIEALRQYYPGNRFVVTSRIVGYDAAPLGGGFNTATLEPFNDEQMSQFFQRWCYAVEESEDIVDDEHTFKRADEKAAQLLEQIKHNPGIRLLAANPLLCTIIGLIQRQGATLPELRVELYILCIDTFIFNWEIKKRQRSDQTGSLDKDQTQAVLEEIALQLHENYPENRIPRKQLTSIVSRFLTAQQGMAESEAEHKAVQLLNLIRDVSGLLIDRGNEEFGFFHLTFQEYLAARAITRKKRDIDRYLSRYLFEPRWREVIRLAAAHASTKDEESGSEFIEAILRQKHPRDGLMHYTFRIAFLCLKEAKVELETSDRMFRQWIEYFLNEAATRELFLQLLRQPGAKIRYSSNTLQILIVALEDENPDVREIVAVALGIIGDKAAADPLIHALQDENSFVRIEAAWALKIIGDKAAIDQLIHSLKNENLGIRVEAAQALWIIGDQAAVDPLIHSLKDEDCYVRKAAAEALGKIGDQATIDPLIHVLQDENGHVRKAAAEVLGRIGDQAAVDPLIHSLKDEDWHVRKAAAEALGKIGDKTAIDSLIHSLKDKNSVIREVAAKALGIIGDKAVIDPLIH
jgi:HEAT repeat protein